MRGLYAKRDRAGCNEQQFHLHGIPTTFQRVPNNQTVLTCACGWTISTVGLGMNGPTVLTSLEFHYQHCNLARRNQQ